jgi:hypothetical protein
MRKPIAWLGMLLMALYAAAGFKAKTVRPKKPEKYQVRAVISGITFAADLLLDGRDQTEFFVKELTPSNVIALRLTILNDSSGEIVISPDDIQLTDPNGKEIVPVDPETVAQAVLQGLPVSSDVDRAPVQVSQRRSRTDKSDPGYDPRLDPTDASYDPTDPRNTGYGRRRDVQIVVNPTDGKYGAISSQLIARDFIDKAYSTDPIPPTIMRDRFIYYELGNRPSVTKGFELRIMRGKGISEPVILRFP